MSWFHARQPAPQSSTPPVAAPSPVLPEIGAGTGSPANLPPMLLIHGSWHGGHHWAQTAQALIAAGVPAVLTPTLPGHGPYVTQRAGTTMDACVDSVVNRLLETPYADVQLVGWSWGGIVAMLAAQRLLAIAPARLGGVTIVDGFVPQPEQPDSSLVGCLEEAAKRHAQEPAIVGPIQGMLAGFRGLVEASADQTLMLPREIFGQVFLRAGTAREDGVGAGVVTEDFVHEVYSRLSPEPWSPLADRVDTTAFFEAIRADPPHRLPVSYVLCGEDQAPYPEFWREQAELLGPHCRHIPAAGMGHEALFTHPRELAAAIVRAAQTRAVRSALAEANAAA